MYNELFIKFNKRHNYKLTDCSSFIYDEVNCKILKKDGLIMKKERSSFSYLYEWANGHKGGYFASIGIAILGVSCGIVPYFAISNIVRLLFSGNKDINSYVIWLVLIATGFVFQILFHNISTYISHKNTFTVIGEVRKKMCDKIAKLPMGSILKRNSGEMKNLIVEKVDSIEPTLAHLVPEMTSKITVPIIIWVLLMTIDWKIGLLSLVTIPVGFLFQMLMMIGYEKKYGRYITAQKNLNSVAVEYINGIEVIKAFNNSAKSYKKFTDTAYESAHSAIDWMRGCQFYFSSCMSIMPATLLTVLPTCLFFFMGDSLNLSEFITIIILSIGLVPPIIGAISFVDDIAKIKTIVSDIASVLDEEELVRPTKEVQFNDYNIILNNVCFGYGDKEVLHNINLEFLENTVSALVGPSGSGKSTITKLIVSMWEVNSGEITIGGHNIKDIPLTQLNKIVAYVSQDNFLFDESVMENIRKGDLNASDEQVIEIAKMSGCHDFIMQLENGYNTVVGGAGGHLSGGERQRVAIARAMLKNAPIIILDEATAYTDPENEAVIQESISKLVKGKTLIVVAHRLSTITDSDNIILVNKGNIDAKGTHKELLKINSLYNNLYTAHIGAIDSKEV